MPKLTYDQMKLLSDSGGDPGGKLVIKNKKGQVMRTVPQKWENYPLMHGAHHQTKRPGTSQASRSDCP